MTFGGSLGARKINTAVADLAEAWADREEDVGRSTTWPDGGTTSSSPIRIRGLALLRSDWPRAAYYRRGALRGSDVPGVPGGRCLCLPRRRHDGGRADGVGRSVHSGSPSGRTPRSSDPQRPVVGGGRGGRHDSRRRVQRRAVGGRARRRCCPTPTGWPPWAPRHADWDTPTPRPAWRSWCRPMPAEAGSGGRVHSLRGPAAPAHPHRGHRRRRHERHCPRPTGHGPHRVRFGPQGVAGSGPAAIPGYSGRGRPPGRERRLGGRRDLLTGRGAHQSRTRCRHRAGRW